jgi:hypothetical protein
MSTSSEITECGPDEIVNIVPPPDCETEEEKIFEDSCILYRFSKEIYEWVGRGIGKIKVLKHKTRGTYRILMRQNQTYRVCLNHQIPYIGSIFPKKGCTREFIWTAYDFSCAKEVRELFAVRFGLPDTANAFKAAFEQGRAANKQVHDSK